MNAHMEGGEHTHKLHFVSQMRKASEFVKGNCISIIFKQLSPFSDFSDISK